jgi:hypothetical protein
MIYNTLNTYQITLNKQLKTTQLTIIHTIKLNKQLKTTQLTIIHIIL